MALQMPTVECQLVLVAAAKAGGGDKYRMEVQFQSTTARERYLYVPQSISRSGTKAQEPVSQFTVTISNAEPAAGFAFKLLKPAKGSGDDRYSPLPGSSWIGDIYLPKEFRGCECIQLTFKEVDS